MATATQENRERRTENRTRDKRATGGVLGECGRLTLRGRHEGHEEPQRYTKTVCVFLSQSAHKGHKEHKGDWLLGRLTDWRLDEQKTENRARGKRATKQSLCRETKLPSIQASKLPLSPAPPARLRRAITRRGRTYRTNRTYRTGLSPLDSQLPKAWRAKPAMPLQAPGPDVCL